MRAEIKNRLLLFSYFENWKEEIIEELCSVAKIKSFEPDDIIYGKKRDFKTFVYFITRGSCRVLEYLLVDKQSKTDSNNNNKNGRFMDIYTMNTLACFNIGEELKNKIIVAREETECLLVPYFWLFEHNICNIWQRISYFLNFNLPTSEQCYQRYLENKSWKKHAQKLTGHKLKPNILGVNYHDIPYTLRIDTLTHELD